MKKIGLFLFLAAAALGFASCNESKVDGPELQSFVVVHVLGSPSDYYFETDAGKKIYPGDKSRVSAYLPVEGQRAVIYFSMLDTPVEGYDHNAVIYAIGKIAAASAESIDTKEELDQVKNDPTIGVAGQLVGRWINLIVRYGATSIEPEAHKFRLIVNNVDEPSHVKEGYLNLELRHDAGTDRASTYYDRYVSFNTDMISGLLAGKEGIVISFNDGNQVQHIEVKRTEIEKQLF